jgi:hypothetical protein
MLELSLYSHNLIVIWKLNFFKYYIKIFPKRRALCEIQDVTNLKTVNFILQPTGRYFLY